LNIAKFSTVVQGWSTLETGKTFLLLRQSDQAKQEEDHAPGARAMALRGFRLAVVAVLTIVAILSSGWQIAANAADNPGEGNGVTQTVDDGSGKPMRVTFVIRIGRPPAHHPSTANWRVHRRCG
jgi:hypothetical protein